MATILNEQAQYVDASGKPLVGGSVYIGDVGADPVLNPKAIFSDRAMTSALANPQTLDANGRTANKIWTDGKYSLQVNDINGVQVFQDIDRGESAITIDILNDISDVITTPANNDTLIITRDEAQAKITFANLLGTVLLSFRGLTQAANKIPYFTSATTSGQLDFVDEDDMAGDSATALPSQQSVKAYVDAYVAGFTSTAQTITSGGLLTVAHGLGERPGSVQLWIKCTTADNGYAIDDEIQIDANSSGAAVGRFNTIYADDTNIYIRFTDETSCFGAGNKATGVSAPLTNASWELYLEARR
jgi:hypothetical protein